MSEKQTSLFMIFILFILDFKLIIYWLGSASDHVYCVMHVKFESDRY